MDPNDTPTEQVNGTVAETLANQDPTQPRWVTCSCTNPYLHFSVQLSETEVIQGAFVLRRNYSYVNVEELLDELRRNGKIDDAQREALWATAQKLGLPEDEEAFNAINGSRPRFSLVYLLFGRASEGW